MLTVAMVSPAQDEQDSPNLVAFKTLVNFNGTNGATPWTFMQALVQGTDGNLYGTTNGGGAHSGGTVFKMTPSGTLKVLYSFCAQPNCADGSGPQGLVLGTDGNFYGATYGAGGAYGRGTIFKISPSGTLKVLYSFCSPAIHCDDSAYPNGITLGYDGNFYGTTNDSPIGPAGAGTVFKITPTGVLTTLWTFCSQPNCADGGNPATTVIQGTDGNFYGTTQEGGATFNGTVFKITPKGELTTLYSFTGGADGQSPQIPLVQAGNGSFYGTMAVAGANNGGTVFEITPAGTYSTVYSFCEQANCTDGSFPTSGLIQATDGNLYGTTADGGADLSCAGVRRHGCGTIFKIATSGALTTLHSFDGTDGQNPLANLMFQATSGIFYGQTFYGGTGNACTDGCGTNYSLSVGLKPFVQLLPTLGKVGRSIRILGTDLTGTTSVTFNGTPATFTVHSATLITATVPAGATTGKVEVMTPTGTLTSNVKFRVEP
jgi:uncharacterized repeat protein (TIGR03803 family)